MKLSSTLLAAVAFTLPAFAIAAEDGKTRPQRQHQAAGFGEALKPFDKNANQQIDADELPAVQQAFTALGKLDKNSNGEIELAEVAAPRPAGRPEAGRARAGEGLSRVDKNGNRRIDPDELEGLQQMLAKAPEFMKRLDQNGNGKLEEGEVARLNERLEKGGAVRRPGAGSSSPSFRRAPEKPADTPKPAETIKPAGQPEKPADAPKFEEKKIEFGS